MKKVKAKVVEKMEQAVDKVKMSNPKTAKKELADEKKEMKTLKGLMKKPKK